MAFSREEWGHVVEELIRVTKPGGFIELFEIDPNYKQPGPSYERIYKSITALCESRGIDVNVVNHLEDFFGSLENVHSESLEVTYGWNKFGELTAQSFRLMALAMTEKIAPELGMNPNQYQQL
ncbi:hypothetical protein BC938DRAFT_484021, partial [Jimgerdemannia flammicorona]